MTLHYDTSYQYYSTQGASKQVSLKKLCKTYM